MENFGGRSRVLVVDDYSDAREMYSEYLQFSGFDVVRVANGVEALQRAMEDLVKEIHRVLGSR